MIIAGLRRELERARQQYQELANAERKQDRSLLIHKRKTVAALEELLARVDAVLVDAVEPIPPSLISRLLQPARAIAPHPRMLPAHAPALRR